MSSRQKFPWSFLLITFAFTWLILLPGILSSHGLLDLPLPIYALVAVAQFGPSLTAFLLARQNESKAGARQLLERAFNFHIPWRWLVLIFLAPLAINGIALLVHRLTGGSLPEMPYSEQPAAILPAFIFTLLLMGPVPEEFGWRGYLLDRLQSRWNSLVASLVLGAIWWIWHLPAAFMEGVAQSYFPQLAYLIWCMAVSMLFTWMYNNTNGNLLAALLFHTMLNLANAIFPPLDLRPGGDQTAFLYATVLYVLFAGIVAASGAAKRLAGAATVRPVPAR
jgi:membrane protease YdiL (CAAX protease family)